MDAVRFEVERDPVAADHRMGEDDDLAGERGIGQDLAPAGGRGREDQVALGWLFSAAQVSLVDAAAFERKQPRRENDAGPGATGGVVSGRLARSASRFPASRGRT